MLLPRGLGTATAATLTWPPGLCQPWGQGQRALPSHTVWEVTGLENLKQDLPLSPVLLICGSNQTLESLGKADVCGKQGLALQLPPGRSSARQLSIPGAPKLSLGTDQGVFPRISSFTPRASPQPDPHGWATRGPLALFYRGEGERREHTALLFPLYSFP